MSRVPAAEFLQLAASSLQVEASALTLETAKDSLAAWDSLAHVVLLLTVEDTYGVKFSLEQLEGFRSLREIYEALPAA